MEKSERMRKHVKICENTRKPSMMIVIGSEDDDNGDDNVDVADGDHDGGKVGVWVENGLMTGVAATLVSCSFPPSPPPITNIPSPSA